jgi:hypothetical protein
MMRGTALILAILLRGGCSSSTVPPHKGKLAAASAGGSMPSVGVRMVVDNSSSSSSSRGRYTTGIDSHELSFAAPVLIGRSNSSKPNGSNFWFPGISIPTGIRGHVAQHITLAGDGSPCPRAGHPSQSCEQIMITTDSGKTYNVVKRLSFGTSGNLNGYGDLGTWVPAKKGSAEPGVFSTLVGCNGCPRTHHASSWEFPMFLQTFSDNGKTLDVTHNVSVSFAGIPASFSSKEARCANHVCGFSSPSQTIIRTANNNLLLACYGHAADGRNNGSLYTSAFFASTDDGLHWVYASRIDATDAMAATKGGEGPCEPAMVTLADGRVLVALRHASDHPLYMAYSTDNGVHWSFPAPMKGMTPAGRPSPVYSVWPQLLLLSNGALVLASGRPGLGFWVSSPNDDGSVWTGYDVIEIHNNFIRNDPYVSKSETTSYTGLAEIEPGVVLLAYDKIGAGRVGAIQEVYSMQIIVKKATDNHVVVRRAS